MIKTTREFLSIKLGRNFFRFFSTSVHTSKVSLKAFEMGKKVSSSGFTLSENYCLFKEVFSIDKPFYSLGFFTQ